MPRESSRPEQQPIRHFERQTVFLIDACNSFILNLLEPRIAAIENATFLLRNYYTRARSKCAAFLGAVPAVCSQVPPGACKLRPSSQRGHRQPPQGRYAVFQRRMGAEQAR